MRRRRVTITGGTGQLGSALMRAAGEAWDIDALSSGDVDIRDWRAVQTRIAAFRPDLVIHTAALTDVDGCEKEPSLAFSVNALGTRNVAQASEMAGAEMVHISTNYVFDGMKPAPYHEWDDTSPINVYGASKLAGEREAIAATRRCFVVRTAWLYSASGRNFVSTMRRLMLERPRLSVVDDQFGNPTLADDLAVAIIQLVERGPYGVYHIVNDGVASWREWALEIARVDRRGAVIDPIPGAEYRRAATPPANGTLESPCLDALGIRLPNWKDALERLLRT